MIKTRYSTVDEYIAGFPKDIQDKLQKLRQTVRKAAPEAEEVISYQMPALKLHGIMAYFAAFKNHIGFFPTASGIAAFKNDLASYETTKGTVRFPLDKPLPLSLIGKIVKYRAKENLRRDLKERARKT
jgi:uncharacterized protein YdhG (YjbR/CyaY superfamily)